MATLLNTKSLYYRDVNLIAQPAKVRSRKEIPIEGHRIVVSAMSSIVGVDFIKAVGALSPDIRPTIHVPRTKNFKELLTTAKEAGIPEKNILVGVGINTPEVEKVAKELGYNRVLLDVANGYLPNVKEAVTRLKQNGFFVVVGSVHTAKGFGDLIEAGADVVRSGIAPGSVCITKEMTGFTRGTLTEMLVLGEAKNSYVKSQPELLADGGFKYPSDIIKAFGAGADYIMTGRLFVDANEAQLRITTDSTRQDVYYGMASALGKEDMGNKIENIEGRLDKLPRNNLKPLQEILDDVWAAIRSGVSYGGHNTLEGFIGKGVFEEISDVNNR